MLLLAVIDGDRGAITGHDQGGVLALRNTYHTRYGAVLKGYFRSARTRITSQAL